MTRSSRIPALVGAALSLLPSLAAGQATQLASEAPEQRAMYELPSITVVAVAEATPLHEEALALYERGEWREAAEMYREAGEEMPENDPNSYLVYDMAGRLYFYGRDYGNARVMMEKAARVAEATGDVVSAANRHVDAAFIAVWEGYAGKRREHVQAAEDLITREGVSAEHAARISALIRGVGTLPVEETEGM